MEIKCRLTKHTHCGSESNLKFSLPCTEKGIILSNIKLACSVTCRSGTSGMPNVKRYRAGFYKNVGELEFLKKLELILGKYTNFIY